MSIWKEIFSRFNKNYRLFNQSIDGKTSYNLPGTMLAKMELALRNPAFLKVAAMQCDMFSLGDFYVYKDGKEVKEHPLLDLLQAPNPFQTKQQFLWEYMFWHMLGVSYLYSDTDNLERLLPNKLYFLKPFGVEYPLNFESKADHLILSSASENSYLKTKIKYRYANGEHVDLALSMIDIFPDLGTPVSRTAFPSRVDALLKPINNNEAAMDALNINTRYSGKFIVTGKTADVNSMPMSDAEKADVETKVDQADRLLAVKSPVDIKRFVENAGNQKLDDVWLHTYFQIGTMYNIPKDVLEAFNSGTFENQEKARGAHVAYTLQPKGDLLTTKLQNRFLKDTKERLYISWEEQPFMQVFAKQRAEAKGEIAKAILDLQKAGVSPEDINAFLDVNFTYNEKAE
jgi:hypothetical protein